MNFRNVSSTEALSEDGTYERRESYNRHTHQVYFNAWHIPTGAHVAAGFSAADISRQVDEHKAREGK